MFGNSLKVKFGTNLWDLLFRNWDFTWKSGGFQLILLCDSEGEIMGGRWWWFKKGKLNYVIDCDCINRDVDCCCLVWNDLVVNLETAVKLSKFTR